MTELFGDYRDARGAISNDGRPSEDIIREARGGDRYVQVAGWVGFVDEDGRVIVTADMEVVATVAPHYEPFALYRKVNDD